MSNADGSTALLVDDEPFALMAAAEMANDAGFAVVTAANADEAVDLLEKRRDIQIIVTDVDMPAGSMDGMTLAHLARKRWPPLHIIVVSGHSWIESADLPARGMFFRKPYNYRQVAAAMRKLAA